jgi:hypothetical protein
VLRKHDSLSPRISFCNYVKVAVNPPNHNDALLLKDQKNCMQQNQFLGLVSNERAHKESARIIKPKVYYSLKNQASPILLYPKYLK